MLYTAEGVGRCSRDHECACCRPELGDESKTHILDLLEADHGDSELRA